MALAKVDVTLRVTSCDLHMIQTPANQNNRHLSENRNPSLGE